MTKMSVHIIGSIKQSQMNRKKFLMLSKYLNYIGELETKLEVISFNR